MLRLVQANLSVVSLSRDELCVAQGFLRITPQAKGVSQRVRMLATLVGSYFGEVVILFEIFPMTLSIGKGLCHRHRHLKSFY